MTRKLLISIVAMLVGVCGSAWAQCELPSDLDNSVVIVDGDLKVSFGCGQSIVQPGDLVDFELIVTNVSSEPVTIWWPVSGGPDVLMIFPASVTDPFSGVVPSAYYYPPILFYIPGEFTLASGECRTYSHTWDTNTHPCVEGDYKAWSGLVSFTPDGIDPTVWITPAGGATLDLHMTGLVGTDQSSMDGIKSLYR